MDPVEGSYDGLHTGRVYEMKITLERKPRSISSGLTRIKEYEWDDERSILTFCAVHPDTAQPLEIKIKL